MPSAVATRYARALVDLATRPAVGQATEGLLQELTTFEQALAVSPALRNVLLSPAVAPVEKRALVNRLSQSLELSDLVRRFLLVVIQRRRLKLLGEIREAVEGLLDEKVGVVRVDVTSARELSDRQREALTAGLAALTGRTPRPQFRVDPELIAGLTARIGSTIYDGSVRGQLEALKRRLVGQEV